MAHLRLLPLLAALLFTSCVAPISVHSVSPEIPATAPAPAPEKIRAFRQLSHRDPAAAAGQLLDAISALQGQIAAGDTQAVDTYNFLVARLVTQIEKAGLEPWNGPVPIPGAATTYLLDARQPRGLIGVERELTPADTLRFSGEYSTTRVVQPGIGAPVIASLPNAGKVNSEIPFDQRFRNLTAVVDVRGSRATLDLVDPFARNSIRFAGADRPLAADYVSHISLGLSRERVDKLGFARLINPSRYADTARLSMTQPYDPQRIPVLMVHGLQDTPATWMPMYLSLMTDPEIRKYYQFWVFSYPSGFPFPYSASLLRGELDRIKREFPDHKDLVIIGHSMGGILSRMMVCDTGDTVWREIFGRSPEESPITGASRQKLEDALIFEARPEIDRAVFYSAPHRGSDLAIGWIGRLGSRLVRTPLFLSDIRDSMISVMTVDAAALQLDRAPNSIDTLAPNNRIVLATSRLSIDPEIPYHSVMGDRGRGDTPDSSDGVVAYWSSHLKGAASEKIVPSRHSSHRHPEGIEEAKRILKFHQKSAR